VRKLHEIIQPKFLKTREKVLLLVGGAQLKPAPIYITSWLPWQLEQDVCFAPRKIYGLPVLPRPSQETCSKDDKWR
jgi:hypothetical protein